MAIKIPKRSQRSRQQPTTETESPTETLNRDSVSSESVPLNDSEKKPGAPKRSPGRPPKSESYKIKIGEEEDVEFSPDGIAEIAISAINQYFRSKGWDDYSKKDEELFTKKFERVAKKWIPKFLSKYEEEVELAVFLGASVLVRKLAADEKQNRSNIREEGERKNGVDQNKDKEQALDNFGSSSGIPTGINFSVVQSAEGVQ
jgi:hypothetical protein